MPCNETDWSSAAANQGMPKTGSKPSEARKRDESIPCQYLDFGLAASKNHETVCFFNPPNLRYFITGAKETNTSTI